MSVAPLASIAVGVIVERIAATSPWTDYLWRPAGVLAGAPDTPPWTALSQASDRTTFYAGEATIELHRTETTNYRDNLATGEPLLWVVLRSTGAQPPYAVYMVTADPAEGEAMTEAGDDIVDSVPMPAPVRDRIAAFVAEHHVERVFVKRKRDRADPNSLGRRPPAMSGPDE
jgi:hypothetical protein